MTLDFKVRISNKPQFTNDPLVPNSIRGLLIGASNCGKSSLLFRMILQPNFIDYDNLYIFSKSLNQQEYQLIINGYMNHLTKEDIIHLFEVGEKLKDVDMKSICEFYSHEYDCKGKITVSAFNSSTVIPDPSSLDSAKKNLMIFDDVIMEKQDKISDYYTRSRHNNTQCFYISQNVMKIPKSTVRENANLIILFKLSDADIRNVHEQLVLSDMD